MLDRLHARPQRLDGIPRHDRNTLGRDHGPRDDELDAVLLEPGGHRGVALLAALVVRGVENAGGDPGRLGPGERAHVRLVGRHRPDRKPAVDERLEVGALPADEDADHARWTRPTTRSPGSGSATTAR